MERIIRIIIKKCLYSGRKFLEMLKNIKKLRHIKKYVYAESFYPEKPHKKHSQILWEQIRHYFKYGDVNEQYFEYGIDVKGIKDDDFLDDFSLKRRIIEANHGSMDYCCTVIDKNLFSIIGNYYGFPIWDSIGFLNNGHVIDKKDNIYDIDEIVKNFKNLFFKPITGGGGKDTYKIQYNEGAYYINNKEMPIENIVETLSRISYSGNSYLCQRLFMQHHLISKLYDKSVNTLRIVTINPQKSENIDDVVVLACILRIGANGLSVDNHGQGGLQISVDSMGKLAQYAFYKPGFGTKIEQHPDSGIAFKDYQIPFYNESIELCKTFHTKLNHIHYIGWDVAFSENGIYLFEANSKSATKLQTFLGPLRQQYAKWLP